MIIGLAVARGQRRGAAGHVRGAGGHICAVKQDGVLRALVPAPAGKGPADRRGAGRRRARLRGRGCHSSTFRLIVSAFCGIGGACRGYLGGV